MKRPLWLLIYALAAMLRMLCTWLEEHAEKRVKGDEQKDEVV